MKTTWIKENAPKNGMKWMRQIRCWADLLQRLP